MTKNGRGKEGGVEARAVCRGMGAEAGHLPRCRIEGKVARIFSHASVFFGGGRRRRARPRSGSVRRRHAWRPERPDPTERGPCPGPARWQAGGREGRGVLRAERGAVRGWKRARFARRRHRGLQRASGAERHGGELVCGRGGARNGKRKRCGAEGDRPSRLAGSAPPERYGAGSRKEGRTTVQASRRIEQNGGRGSARNSQWAAHMGRGGTGGKKEMRRASRGQPVGGG